VANQESESTPRPRQLDKACEKARHFGIFLCRNRMRFFD
jgi:hypothetical protein